VRRHCAAALITEGYVDTGSPSRLVSGPAAMVVPFFFMIDWSSCPVVERDPQRVSGAWVFRGTRVPVSALFENLEDGALVSEFVDWFPGVGLEQVRAVLDHAARSALATS
jgi:uncharacterized protein (DUF433 family)